MGHFLPFYSPDNPENQNLEKMKKIPGNIIISHKSTVNDNHMMYDSWDMKRDRQNCCHFGLFFNPNCPWDMVRNGRNCYFSFLAIFCPFTSLKTWKIKTSKKRKIHLKTSSFYSSVPKTMIIRNTIPEIWRMTDVIVIFHFELLSALLPPTPTPHPPSLLQQPKKSKFQKNEKNSWMRKISS